jgi:hypothetical protein
VSRWQTAEAEWFLRRTLLAEDRRLFPVLTRPTNATSLPGFLRNIRRLELSAHLTPHEVARQLRNELTGDPVSEVDDSGALLIHAIKALEGARTGTRNYQGWFRIEQTLHAIDGVELHIDLDSLRGLVHDLERTTRDSRGEGIVAPPNVVVLVNSLVNRIDRRLKKLSRPSP